MTFILWWMSDSKVELPGRRWRLTAAVTWRAGVHGWIQANAGEIEPLQKEGAWEKKRALSPRAATHTEPAPGGGNEAGNWSRRCWSASEQTS